jgi:hypothetical protein
VADSSAEHVEAEVVRLLREVGRHPNLIAGTGVLPAHTPPGNVLAAKRAVAKAFL